MYDVRISDSLYQQVRQAAQNHHVTVDDFVVSAVEKCLSEQSASPSSDAFEQADPTHPKAPTDQQAEEFFTPERVYEIREAAVEARTGNNISLEQHKAEMKQLRAHWKANSRS